MESLTGLVLMSIPMAAMAFWIIIIYIIFHFVYRSEKQFHDTLQAMLKSGQPITPELLTGIPGYVNKKQDKDDVRTGFVMTGTGTGIALLGYFGLGLESVMGVGLLVFSTGLGILAYGLYRKNKGNG